MSNKKRTFLSNSSLETEEIASLIGSRLRGGEIIELVSDLGGGKTTFTRGVVAGADSSDVVSSPTFTISRVYTAPRFEIHHFDFYRLPDAGLITYEVEDLLNDEGVVLIIEWGGAVAEVLPKDRVKIEIVRTGDDSRSLTLDYPDELAYIVEGI